MKKTLLSLAIVSSALFVSAQTPGISTTAAFDDFMTTDPYTATTTELGFDDVTKTAKTEMATKGIFWWTDAVTDPAGFDYSWTRGTGSLMVKLDKPYGNYDPMGLGFGNYAASASATTSTPFSIDLSANAVLSITLKAVTDTAQMSVLFQLKDAKGTVLYIDKAVALEPTAQYKYQVGFADNNKGNYDGAKGNLKPNNTAVTFTYDFKNALPGSYPNFEADNSSFDYTKVTELAIFFTNAHQNAADNSYAPFPLHTSVEITNLKLGDVTSIVAGISSDEVAANNNEVVSVYDMMGKFVATGKLKELGLESGKLYVVKSGNKSRKIVMN
jgi:hypothetical protein